MRDSIIIISEGIKIFAAFSIPFSTPLETINAVIILRQVDSSTRVTVNLNGNVGVEVRNGYGVVSASQNTCPSRGIFEEKLFTLPLIIDKP